MSTRKYYHHTTPPLSDYSPPSGARGPSSRAAPAPPPPPPPPAPSVNSSSTVAAASSPSPSFPYATPAGAVPAAAYKKPRAVTSPQRRVLAGAAAAPPHHSQQQQQQYPAGSSRLGSAGSRPRLQGTPRHVDAAAPASRQPATGSANTAVGGAGQRTSPSRDRILHPPHPSFVQTAAASAAHPSLPSRVPSSSSSVLAPTTTAATAAAPLSRRRPAGGTEDSHDITIASASSIYAPGDLSFAPTVAGGGSVGGRSGGVTGGFSAKPVSSTAAAAAAAQPLFGGYAGNTTTSSNNGAGESSWRREAAALALTPAATATPDRLRDGGALRQPPNYNGGDGTDLRGGAHSDYRNGGWGGSAAAAAAAPLLLERTPFSPAPRPPPNAHHDANSAGTAGGYFSSPSPSGPAAIPSSGSRFVPELQLGSAGRRREHHHHHGGGDGGRAIHNCSSNNNSGAFGPHNTSLHRGVAAAPETHWRSGVAAATGHAAGLESSAWHRTPAAPADASVLSTVRPLFSTAAAAAPHASGMPRDAPPSPRQPPPPASLATHTRLGASPSPSATPTAGHIAGGGEYTDTDTSSSSSSSSSSSTPASSAPSRPAAAAAVTEGPGALAAAFAARWEADQQAEEKIRVQEQKRREAERRQQEKKDRLTAEGGAALTVTAATAAPVKREYDCDRNHINDSKMGASAAAGGLEGDAPPPATADSDQSQRVLDDMSEVRKIDPSALHDITDDGDGDGAAGGAAAPRTAAGGVPIVPALTAISVDWPTLQTHLRHGTHRHHVTVLDLAGYTPLAATAADDAAAGTVAPPVVLAGKAAKKEGASSATPGAQWRWLCEALLPEMTALQVLRLSGIGLRDCHVRWLQRGGGRGRGAVTAPPTTAQRLRVDPAAPPPWTESFVNAHCPESETEAAAARLGRVGKSRKSPSPLPPAGSRSATTSAEAAVSPGSGGYARESYLPALRVLDLSDNALTHRAASAVGRLCLWLCDTLEELRLRGNPLRDYGLQILGVYLSKLNSATRQESSHLFPRSAAGGEEESGGGHAVGTNGRRRSAAISGSRGRSQRSASPSNMAVVTTATAAGSSAPSPPSAVLFFGPSLLDVRHCRGSPRGLSELLAGATAAAGLRTLLCSDNCSYEHRRAVLSSPARDSSDLRELSRSGAAPQSFSSFKPLHFPSALTHLWMRAVPLSETCAAAGCRELFLNVFFCCPRLALWNLAGCFRRDAVPPAQLRAKLDAITRQQATLLRGSCAAAFALLQRTRNTDVAFRIDDTTLAGQTCVGDVFGELVAHAAFNAARRQRPMPPAFASLRELHLNASGMTDAGAQGLCAALRLDVGALAALAVLNVADNLLTAAGCVQLLYELVVRKPSAGAGVTPLVALAMQGNAGMLSGDEASLRAVCDAADAAVESRLAEAGAAEERALAAAAAAAAAQRQKRHSGDGAYDGVERAEEEEEDDDDDPAEMDRVAPLSIYFGSLALRVASPGGSTGYCTSFDSLRDDEDDDDEEDENDSVAEDAAKSGKSGTGDLCRSNCPLSRHYAAPPATKQKETATTAAVATGTKEAVETAAEKPTTEGEVPATFGASPQRPAPVSPPPRSSLRHPVTDSDDAGTPAANTSRGDNNDSHAGAGAPPQRPNAPANRSLRSELETPAEVPTGEGDRPSDAATATATATAAAAANNTQRRDSSCSGDEPSAPSTGVSTIATGMWGAESGIPPFAPTPAPSPPTLQQLQLSAAAPDAASARATMRSPDSCRTSPLAFPGPNAFSGSFNTNGNNNDSNTNGSSEAFSPGPATTAASAASAASAQQRLRPSPRSIVLSYVHPAGHFLCRAMHFLVAPGALGEHARAALEHDLLVALQPPEDAAARGAVVLSVAYLWNSTGRGESSSRRALAPHELVRLEVSSNEQRAVIAARLQRCLGGGEDDDAGAAAATPLGDSEEAVLQRQEAPFPTLLRLLERVTGPGRRPRSWDLCAAVEAAAAESPALRAVIGGDYGGSAAAAVHANHHPDSTVLTALAADPAVRERLAAAVHPVWPVGQASPSPPPPVALTGGSSGGGEYVPAATGSYAHGPLGEHRSPSPRAAPSPEASSSPTSSSVSVTLEATGTFPASAARDGWGGGGAGGAGEASGGGGSPDSAARRTPAGAARRDTPDRRDRRDGAREPDGVVVSSGDDGHGTLTPWRGAEDESPLGCSSLSPTASSARGRLQHLQHGEGDESGDEEKKEDQPATGDAAEEDSLRRRRAQMAALAEAQGRLKTYTISHAHKEGGALCRGWRLLHRPDEQGAAARAALEADLLELLQPPTPNEADDSAPVVSSVSILFTSARLGTASGGSSSLLQLQVRGTERRSALSARLLASHAGDSGSGSGPSASVLPSFTALLERSGLDTVAVLTACVPRATLAGLCGAYESPELLVHYFHGTDAVLAGELGVSSLEELEARAAAVAAAETTTPPPTTPPHGSSSSGGGVGKEEEGTGADDRQEGKGDGDHSLNPHDGAAEDHSHSFDDEELGEDAKDFPQGHTTVRRDRLRQTDTRQQKKQQKQQEEQQEQQNKNLPVSSNTSSLSFDIDDNPPASGGRQRRDDFPDEKDEETGDRVVDIDAAEEEEEEAEEVDDPLHSHDYYGTDKHRDSGKGGTNATKRLADSRSGSGSGSGSFGRGDRNEGRRANAEEEGEEEDERRSRTTDRTFRGSPSRQPQQQQQQQQQRPLVHPTPPRPTPNVDSSTNINNNNKPSVTSRSSTSHGAGSPASPTFFPGVVGGVGAVRTHSQDSFPLDSVAMLRERKHRWMQLVAYTGMTKGVLPLDAARQQKLLLGKGKIDVEPAAVLTAAAVAGAVSPSSSSSSVIHQKISAAIEWEIMFVLYFEKMNNSSSSSSSSKRQVMLVHPVAFGFDYETSGKDLIVRIERSSTPESFGASADAIQRHLLSAAADTMPHVKPRKSSSSSKGRFGRSLRRGASNLTSSTATPCGGGGKGRQDVSDTMSEAPSEAAGAGAGAGATHTGGGAEAVVELFTRPQVRLVLHFDSKKTVRAAAETLEDSIRRAKEAVLKSISMRQGTSSDVTSQ